MSIAEKITELNAVKDDIFDAIKAKGVTVPAGSGLADVPGLIGSIPSGTGDTITVDGHEYGYVRIGNRYYTTENLMALFDGDIIFDGSFSDPAAIWFNNNETQAKTNKWNMAYSVNAIDVINTHLTDGWRVWTQSDIAYFAQNFASNTKFCAWSNNECGLSLVRNGNGATDKSAFYNVDNVANLRTSTVLCAIDTSGSYTADASSTGATRWAALRLVKDVT